MMMMIVVLSCSFPALLPLADSSSDKLNFDRANRSVHTMKNKGTKEPYYVTWQDTFYPESASVSNEPPSSTPPGHVDRWGTVWAEARLIEDDDTSASSSHEKIIATEEESVVVPPMNVSEIRDAEGGGRVQDGQEDEPRTSFTSEDVRNSLPNRHAALAAAAQPLSHASSRKPCAQGHLLDIIVGSSLTFTGVAAIFAIEVSAFVIYAVAVGFFQLCRILEDLSSRLPFLWVFYHVFLFVTVVLMMADSLVLAVSVMISEILAAVTCLLCTLLGCSCAIGSDWHQFVRKMCHLTRWAVRGMHQKWTPERRIFSYKPGAARAQASTQTPVSQDQIGQKRPTTTTEHPGTTVASHPRSDPLAPARPVSLN